MSERCAWCGDPALEQVETQPGAYKTTSDPQTGRTAKICTRLPVLTWCKPPTGFSMGGTYGNASEFVLFARRGNLKANTRISQDWFAWPRSGGHSAKPEAFIDLVEVVSPGPYLEMFARRARFGWDYWGNESLGTADMPDTAA